MAVRARQAQRAFLEAEASARRAIELEWADVLFQSREAEAGGRDSLARRARAIRHAEEDRNHELLLLAQKARQEAEEEHAAAITTADGKLSPAAVAVEVDAENPVHKGTSHAPADATIQHPSVEISAIENADEDAGSETNLTTAEPDAIRRSTGNHSLSRSLADVDVHRALPHALAAVVATHPTEGAAVDPTLCVPAQRPMPYTVTPARIGTGASIGSTWCAYIVAPVANATTLDSPGASFIRGAAGGPSRPRLYTRGALAFAFLDKRHAVERADLLEGFLSERSLLLAGAAEAIQAAWFRQCVQDLVRGQGHGRANLIVEERATWHHLLKCASQGPTETWHAAYARCAHFSAIEEENKMAARAAREKARRLEFDTALTQRRKELRHALEADRDARNAARQLAIEESAAAGGGSVSTDLPTPTGGGVNVTRHLRQLASQLATDAMDDAVARVSASRPASPDDVGDSQTVGSSAAPKGDLDGIRRLLHEAVESLRRHSDGMHAHEAEMRGVSSM
jgi:hypothetical protein